MRQKAPTSGPHGIGALMHVIHIAGNLPELNTFYEDVLGGVIVAGTDAPDHLPDYGRYASVAMVSDLAVETIAPVQPVDGTTSIGRFYERFGAHLHSMGYVCEDVEGLAAHLERHGVPTDVRSIGDHRFFFSNAKFTEGHVVEFLSHRMDEDLRALESWSSLRKLWTEHPLGIEGVSHLTVGVRSRGASSALFERLWSAALLHEGGNHDLGSSSAWLELGNSVVELAEPTSAGSPLGRHVEQFGTMLYAVTFRVRDLRSAAQHLTDKGVRSDLTSQDVLTAAPEDCHGALFRFTDTGPIPRDVG